MVESPSLSEGGVSWSRFRFPEAVLRILGVPEWLEAYRT
jgi:hypothetical protein